MWWAWKYFFKSCLIAQLEYDAEAPDSKAMKWQKFVEVRKTEEVVRVGWKYSSKAVDEDKILGTESHGFGDTCSHGLLQWNLIPYTFGIIINQ